MIQARYSAATKYPWNQGRLEVSTLLGILVNTIPSSFYMLVQIYSDPALLQDIRDELEATSVLDVLGETKRSLCIITMREKCQLLHSTFQELLGLHAQGAGARFVREDTLIDGQYLLKKGMVIQMPMAVMHSDPSIWGPHAQEFQPRRFLKQNGGGNASKTALTAYRLFGGGASMCPGRHFATLEILALTAYMILRFDIVPSHGEWRIPEPEQESLATNVFPPKKDLQVRIIPRQGSDDIRGDFVMK